MAFKVFTNGSVLQASEVNENLMRQSVSTFSNAAARTAAITSPSEGMLTYLEDVNRYDTWNSTAWVPAFGLTHLNTTAFTGQIQVNVDNVFSSAFDNYKIVFNLTSTSVNGADVFVRLRAGGTTNQSSNYNVGGMLVGAAASLNFASTNNASSTLFQVGSSNDTRGCNGEMNLYRPFLTQATAHTTSSVGNLFFNFGGLMTVTTPYDGFAFGVTSGTATGTLRVYGSRNS